MKRTNRVFASIMVFVITSSMLLTSMPIVKAEYEWDSYQRYAEIVVGLQNLVSSGIAEVETIGETYHEIEIKAIKISDNPGVDEADEPDILFVGLHHAREWISAEVPYYLAVNLVQRYATDPTVKALVDSCEIWVVPVINPDGYWWSHENERYWRKNTKPNSDGTYGVDLNRNYGYHWGEDLDPDETTDGSDVTSDYTYWGPSAFSEAETDAIRDLLTDSQHNFQAVLSYHSYSQLILYPWAYTDFPRAEDAGLMDNLAAEMAELIYNVHGKTYTPQQAFDLYPVSGDMIDWVYNELGIPAFSIELRPEWEEGLSESEMLARFELPEVEILPTCEENWPAALYLINYVMSDNSIQRGLDWLRTQQDENSGSWSYMGENVGLTSLCALSFLNHGTLDEDVEKALDWIVSQNNIDGSISVVGGSRDFRVYDTSLAILALVAGKTLGYNPPGTNLNTIINDAVDFLRDSQCVGASIDGHVYDYSDEEYGGWGYPVLDPDEKWADLSNTQFAVLALAAATMTGASSVPFDVWENVAVFAIRCLSDSTLNPLWWGGVRDDGGFQYKPGWWSGSRGSMTGAGIWTLGLCKSAGVDSVTVDGGVVSLDDGIADGLEWLVNRGYLDENWPDMNLFYYYYLLSVAKAYVIVDEGYDWYRSMVATLMPFQEIDGHWPIAYYEENDVLVTAEAILAIQTRMPSPPGVSAELYVILGSPANLYITDPVGRHVGIDPNTGEVVNEISGATFSVNLEQVASIPNPLSGEYDIKVVGTETGTYTLTLEGEVNGQLIYSESYSGMIASGIVREWTSIITRVVGPLTLITTPIKPVIIKAMSPTEASLGDLVHVALQINNPGTTEVEVSDTLPAEFDYVGGSFFVDGSPEADPSIDDSTLSFDCGLGEHLVEFDVRVNIAYGEDTVVHNTATCMETESTASVTIREYTGPTISKTTDGPDIVPLFTPQDWTFTYIIKNNYDYTMTDVQVKDHLGAELDIYAVEYDSDHPYGFWASAGNFSYSYSRGRMEQLRFNWIIESLTPGEAVMLQITAYTDENPKGKQEYTSPGVHTLNGGATIKWRDEDEKQWSMKTPPITVLAVGQIHGYVTEEGVVPVAEIPIQLYDSTGTKLVASTLTDENGFYSFQKLEINSYVVKIVVPIGYTCSEETKTAAATSSISMTELNFTLMPI